MAAALDGHFSVLAAGTAESALGLIARHGPCGAAFCEIPDDPESGLDFAARLAQASPGIAVTALIRPPCPKSMLRAVADGILDGVCLLPLSPESLREKARSALAEAHRRRSPTEASSGILTREEVEFLLGRDLADKSPGTRRQH
jgi:hypothetical protein